MIILGGHYAEEMKGDKGLSTGEYTKMVISKHSSLLDNEVELLQLTFRPLKELMGDLPGFEPFSFAGDHRDLMHTVITKKLNRALRKLPSSFPLQLASAFDIVGR